MIMTRHALLRRLIGFVLIIAACLALTPIANADTVVFQEGVNGYAGTIDTFLKQAAPASDNGTAGVVEWDGDDGGGQNIGLLRFDNIFGADSGRVPGGAIITSATLTYTVGNPGNAATVNEVLVDWTQGVTYDTFGGDAGVQPDEYNPAAVGSAAGTSGANSLDVTSSISAWSLNPAANKGWVFRPTGGTDGVEFASSESATVTQRPKLTVEYLIPAGVEILPVHLDAVEGSANLPVTVYIPRGSNDHVDVHVTLTTDNAAVAVPVGAAGGALVITFDMGSDPFKTVAIAIGEAGTATITSMNDAGLGNDTLTVDVAAGSVTLSPASVTAVEGADRPVKVSITPGSNDTRTIVVTLSTDNAAVAEAVGAMEGSLDVTFTTGGSTEQAITLDIGVAGTANISTSNDSGLANAVVPVKVAAGFNFTATADPRDKITRWDLLLAAINTNIGGPGVFHVSAGDIDPLQPLRDAIDARFGPATIWFPGIGNHEAETAADMVWLRDEYKNGNGVRTPLKNYTNQDGPVSTVETTYSWDHGNAHFVMLNQYWDGVSDTGTDGDVIPALRDWLAADLAANVQPVVFVFGHEPAYPFHRHVGDSLDKYPANRDAFWSLLEANGVHAFVCGHTHVYKRYQPNPGGTWQIDVGNAGNVSSDWPDEPTFLNVTVTDTEVVYDIWRSVAIDSGTYTLEDTWTEPIGPKIGLAPTSLARTVDQGGNLTNDTFDITKVGTGTINYTITDNVDWLSVSPDNGATAGETDTIDVVYNVSALPRGQHMGTITISSDDAVNSPRIITVTVEVVGPTIVLSDSVIERTVFVGNNLPADTFTVANGGPGTLNYEITDNVSWLDVSPESGDSAGEADPINVLYAVSDRPVGQYPALITVSSLDAANSPQTIAVSVAVVTVSPDFNGDGDVDQADFGHFQACLSGSGAAQNAPECLDAHLDGDGDVDRDDFAILCACLSGTNVPADPACDDLP